MKLPILSFLMLTLSTSLQAGDGADQASAKKPKFIHKIPYACNVRGTHKVTVEIENEGLQQVEEAYSYCMFLMHSPTETLFVPEAGFTVTLGKRADEQGDLLEINVTKNDQPITSLELRDGTSDFKLGLPLSNGVIECELSSKPNRLWDTCYGYR